MDLSKIDTSQLDEDELSELFKLLKDIEDHKKYNYRDSLFPAEGPLCLANYPKHKQFLDAGEDFKLRLLMAGNRVGKTVLAAYELSYHLTGNYPEWWQGKRFTGPSNWWVCGVDSKVILGNLQPLLLGKVNEFGSGMIPRDSLDFSTIKDAKKVDTPISMFRVKHASGGLSSVEFKSYESGREAFQSFAGSIWLDEEPPLAIYTECLMRTMGDHIMMITFTPLKGPTDTILSFLEGKTYAEGAIGIGKHVTTCTWDEVPHLDEKDKKILLAATPPWLREARTRGIPQMGSGAIFQVPLEDITVKPFEIPKHWKRYAGMDVGNKTAAIWFAISPDNGIHYGYHEYYKEGQLPSVHAESIVLPGKWVPIAIDHAAHGRSQIDGKNLFDMYTEYGLKLHNADKSVESGLYTCWSRLSDGRIKIFSTLKRFAEEYQMYRKDEKGNVVKTNDHMMDSFRYAQMTGVDLACNEQSMVRDYIPGQVSAQYRPQPNISRRF